MFKTLQNYFNKIILNRNHVITNESVEESDRKFVLIILFVGVFLSLPLLIPGYFYGHDSVYPLYRIISMDAAFNSGQLPVKVLPNLVNGFGYGWNLFYAPLSYDITFIIHRLGLPVINAMKVFDFLTICLSGIFMYYFIKRVSKDNSMAVFAAIFYMTSPYRLVDMYVRSAYAESLTFVFLPLVFWGMYEIMYGNQKKFLLLGVALSGLILSHNITAFYSVLFIGLFMLLNIKVFLKAPIKLLEIIGAGVFSLLLSAYYLVPLIQHRLHGNYAVFENNYMATADSVSKNTVHFLELLSSFFRDSGNLVPFVSLSGEMTFSLGIILIICGLISLCFIKYKDKIKRDFTPYLICGIASTLMTTWIFPWKSMPGFMLFIQFPWRLLVFTSFFFSIFAAVLFYRLNREYRGKVIKVVVISLCILSVPYLLTRNDPFLKEKYAPQYENIKEFYVLGYTCGGEYLPVNAINNQKYLRSRSRGVLIEKGKAEILNTDLSGSRLTFNVENASQNTLLELPMIYYLGYEGYAISGNGEKKKIDIYESKNGFCEINVAKSAKIDISYKGTAAGRGSFYFSLLMFLVAIYILWRKNIALLFRRTLKFLKRI